jgi:hypothetical protein
MVLQLLVVTSCVKVVNKTNLQSKTPSRVTVTHDNIMSRSIVTSGNAMQCYIA